MKVLVIIPAYNEELNILRVVDSLVTTCPGIDYLIVNDGSADDTSAVCRAAGYNIIDLPCNLGLAGAFQTGMLYAQQHGFDAALQFDGDGQHLPQYIEGMVQQMTAAGSDIVIGSRFVNRHRGFSARMLGSRFISASIRLTTGKVLRDPTSGMRLYSRRVIDQFCRNINYTPEPDTVCLLMRQGAQVTEYPVEMAERLYGTSYLNWIQSIKYMIRMGISILLLQWIRG